MFLTIKKSFSQWFYTVLAGNNIDQGLQVLRKVVRERQKMSVAVRVNQWKRFVHETKSKIAASAHIIKIVSRKLLKWGFYKWHTNLVVLPTHRFTVLSALNKTVTKGG